MISKTTFENTKKGRTDSERFNKEVAALGDIFKEDECISLSPHKNIQTIFSEKKFISV